MESVACGAERVRDRWRLHDVEFMREPIAYLHGIDSESGGSCGRGIEKGKSLIEENVMMRKTEMNRREAIKRAALALGFTLSASAIDGIALAVEGSGASGAASGKFFDEFQRGIVEAFIDCLLPRSDTPGGLDVGVLEFADIYFERYAKEEAVQKFPLDMVKLNRRAKDARDKDFVALTRDQQTELLVAMAKDDESRDIIQSLRSVALLGYFSSEEVGTKVMKFDPVPGHYDGCIPLSDTDGIAWTI